jgi:hypothetical protein
MDICCHCHCRIPSWEFSSTECLKCIREIYGPEPEEEGDE